MEKEKKWFSVLDVEKQTGIPNQTIRRYINNHGIYLNPKKRGKGYYLAEESVKVIQQIRKLYDEGMTAQLVNDTLHERNIPMTITISEREEKVSVQVDEALQDLKKGMDEQNEVIRSLVEQVKKQQEYIDNKLEERDKKLMAAIRETQEARKEISASQEEPKEEKKKGWIARLFGM
jgi:DNA-binding transcriptional MerR regulator